MGEAEKVGHGNRDAGFRHSVIKTLKSQSPHYFGSHPTQRHPNVTQRTRTFDICEDNSFARSDRSPRSTLARAVQHGQAPHTSFARRIFKAYRAAIDPFIHEAGVHDRIEIIMPRGWRSRTRIYP